MTVRRFTGRYDLSIKTLLGRLASLLLVLCAVLGHAAPAQLSVDETAEALAVAEGAWADILGDSVGVQGEYDEQIFTELSPLIDTPEGIKLPDDQLLTD